MSTTAGSSSIHTDGDAIHFDLQAVAASPIVGSVPSQHLEDLAQQRFDDDDDDYSFVRSWGPQSSGHSGGASKLDCPPSHWGTLQQHWWGDWRRSVETDRQWGQWFWMNYFTDIRLSYFAWVTYFPGSPLPRVPDAVVVHLYPAHYLPSPPIEFINANQNIYTNIICAKDDEWISCFII